MTQELDNALYIAKSDASGWTSQDVQTLAEAYRNAWENRDCEALEALSNAMSDISYGESEEIKGLFREYDYSRDYSVTPDAAKYDKLMKALDSNKDGEMYYTLSRVKMIPTEIQTVQSDDKDNRTASFSYDFGKNASGMQVSLSTSAQGVSEKNLYTITSADMNKVVSADSISRLQGLGYAENEIATMKASALTDADVDFIGKLAAGNYEAAYRVDPSGLSDFTKVGLSTYQAILGTRTDSSVSNADIQKQINILYDQDLDHIMNGPADNAYPEYVSLIAAGLQQQSLKYGENMEELYDKGIYITDEYFDYGDNLNRTVALWDSFDNISRVNDIEWLDRIYDVGLREGAFDLQVSELKVSEAYGQYQYKLNIVDGKTGELLPEQYGMEVEMQKLSAIDALRAGYVAENIENTKELENIKKNTVINASIELIDGLHPFPLKDTLALGNAIQDVTTNASDISGTLNMAKNVGNIDSENDILSAVGEVCDVAGSVVEAIGSGISDYKKTQAEIAYNNEYLTYSFNGQLSEMKFYLGLETGSGETQIINVGRNCMAPEVQYNMLRWQKEGIGVYLNDIGFSEDDKKSFIKSLDLVKLTSELKTVATAEEVSEAVDIMLNGGDISQISNDVRAKIQERINSFCDNRSEQYPSIDSWLEQRNIPEPLEIDWEKDLNYGSPRIDFNEVEQRLTILSDADGNLHAVEGLPEMDWHSYRNPGLRLELNDNLVR